MPPTPHGKLWLGDCLELMDRIPDGKVDMVFADLPYARTDAEWDSAIIPWEPLWAGLLRVCKKDAAIVMTSIQPFTTALIDSQRDLFKYCWYWIKNKKSGFCIAKYQPMRMVEEVCVFYREHGTYNPQGIRRIAKQDRRTKVRNSASKTIYEGKANGHMTGKPYTPEFENFPEQVLFFDADSRADDYSLDKKQAHPTQKPVALVDYLIRTYTNPGEVVLDVTCGSGTTGVAALRCGRRFVCMEKDPEIFQLATNRISAAQRNPGFSFNA